MVSILYTGVVNATTANATLRDGVHSFRETQCLATSTDPELNVWSKLQQPVIALPPNGLTVTGFRDPSAWRTGDWWYLTVGSGTHARLDERSGFLETNRESGRIGRYVGMRRIVPGWREACTNLFIHGSGSLAIRASRRTRDEVPS